jgi:hypothetical protein
MKSEPSAGHRSVLQGPAHEPRRGNGYTVIREANSTRIGQLGHLRQLGSSLSFRDGREETDRNVSFRARGVDERAERGRRVDDRICVRHRQDRAIPASCSGGSSRCDRLLVLASGRAQMYVRVHERGRQQQPVGLDHPVGIGVQACT